jgi:hypothetical protein
MLYSGTFRGRSGAITRVIVVEPGSGYRVPPIIQVLAYFALPVLTRVIVVEEGSGYRKPPIVQALEYSLY